MKNGRYFRKTKFKRRSHLTIAVLPDEEAVFAAYRLLQYHNISPEYLAIVGKNYNLPEWVGLLKPMKIALRQAFRLAIVTSILGAGLTAVVAIAWQTGLTLPGIVSWWLFVLAASLFYGFSGAVVGALMGLLGEGSTAGIYRHHLRQGRYLLMIEGPEQVVRLGKQILSQYATAPKNPDKS